MSGKSPADSDERGPGLDERLPGLDERVGDVDIDDLLDHLEDLEASVDTHEEREDIRDAMWMARNLSDDDIFGEEIRKYTGRDMAEAFVGAILFAVPLLVEDGVFDIAAHFLSGQVLGVPVFFLVNTAFVVLMTYGLIYWTGIQDVYVNRPLLGVIPRRLVGVLVISFLTTAAMMTLWGRVGGWTDPVVAFARVSVVWTVAAFGAGLGDILPGESKARDVNDVLGEI
ncbi:MAG: DUF2391 domain-containing protein [Haloarculaceae archaeon]